MNSIQIPDHLNMCSILILIKQSHHTRIQTLHIFPIIYQQGCYNKRRRILALKSCRVSQRQCPKSNFKVHTQCPTDLLALDILSFTHDENQIIEKGQRTCGVSKAPAGCWQVFFKTDEIHDENWSIEVLIFEKMNFFYKYKPR